MPIIGRRAFVAGTAAAAVARTIPAFADDYPNRPITLVIPLPPGGTNDIMARSVADHMSATLGQQIVIENRPLGGTGTVATRAVAHGPADGYTLLLAYTSTMATGPHMLRNVGYDFRKDFAPVGTIGYAPALILAHPSVPYRDASDLIAAMRASKQPFQVGTPGISSVNHLTAMLFAQQAGVKLEYIPYKGSQLLITDVIGGFVKVGFNPIPVSRAAIEGKLIRALAATSIKRSSAFPDLPTVAESGLPGFDAVLTYGIVAPAATPRPIVDKLNSALRGALASDEVKKRLAQEGAEPLPTTPEEHAAILVREDAKWSALINTAGIAAK